MKENIFGFVIFVITFLMFWPLIWRFSAGQDYKDHFGYIFVAKPLAWGALWSFFYFYVNLGNGAYIKEVGWLDLPKVVLTATATHYLLIFIFKATGFLGMSFASRSDDQHRRGQGMHSPAEVAGMVKKRGEEWRWHWGGVPVPQSIETRSFLLAGSPGTGKSQAILAVLDPMQKLAGARGIIADPSAAFLRRYKRADSKILNPFDERGVDWSPFAEMQNAWDAATLAKSMIPDGDGSAAEWNGYAQTFLEALLLKLWEAGTATNGDLYQYSCVAPVEALRELVAGTAAAPLLAEGNDKMLGAVRAIVGSYLKPYSYLNPNTGKDGFSIKDHVINGAGWLFITYRQDQREALKPLIGAALDIASRALLTTKPDLNRRFFFVLDEFPLLGKVTSIVDLLTNGRKHGGACLIGIQTVAQLRATYGREAAQTILSCLGTWLVLRCNDAETAKYMSDHAGKEEVTRTNQSGGTSDGKKSENWAQQVVGQDVLLPSEIQNWPDLQGVLNLAGDYPICPILLQIADEVAERCADFETRAGGYKIIEPMPLAAQPDIQPPTLPAPAKAAGWTIG